MRVLRGEEVDWTRSEEAHVPRRRCALCGQLQFKHDVQPSQWGRRDERHACKECVQLKARAGTPLECMTCFRWLQESAFDAKNRYRTYARRECQ